VDAEFFAKRKDVEVQHGYPNFERQQNISVASKRFNYYHCWGFINEFSIFFACNTSLIYWTRKLEREHMIFSPSDSFQ